MTAITTHTDLTDDQCAEAWALYHGAFQELNAYTVQRHLMYRTEFDEVMGDKRVAKYLATDGARLVGVATYTNDLDAVPLISPQYFQRRWPDLYAERRIWYCGFVAVHPDAQNTGVFAPLITAMASVAAARHGIVGIDMCRYNDEARRLSRAVPLLLNRAFGHVRPERADEQSYWLYEFPDAAQADAPAGMPA